MTRYPNRLPLGASVGHTSTDAPRYVPGAVRPLNCAPLSPTTTRDEADTRPALDALPLPRVVYRRQRRSRLYWLVRDVGWWFADIGNELRYCTGWVGEVALMVLFAVACLALALAVVLWGLR